MKGVRCLLFIFGLIAALVGRCSSDDEAQPAVFSHSRVSAAGIDTTTSPEVGNLASGLESSSEVATPMDTVEVRGTVLTERRLQNLSKVLNTQILPPTLQQGGILFRKKLGAAEVEVGAVERADLFAKDAVFKEKKAKLQIEFVHFRF